MNGESLLIFLLVGALAGWLGGIVVKGYGIGLVGDIVVGVIGSFIGGWLFNTFHIVHGTGFFGTGFQQEGTTIMFKLRYAFAAALVAYLIGGVAAAEPNSTPPPPSATAPIASQGQSAPAASDHATQASATATDSANVIVTSTIDAYGDRHLVISDPPVPDTPDNRAKYGQPLSNAGQQTHPAGN
jgi:uncharacterized membrane protein YeaQ/YmgE (transglycosylase-associated protein family)